MTRKQDQSVEQGGQANQAGRDLPIHQGLTAVQMSEIMVALAGQLAKYHQEAEQKADERFSELRESLLGEFAKPNSEANAEAFNEPDFQSVVQSAHETYARSGDDALKDELVRLLIQRSTNATGSRVALVLNQAIEVAGSLTPEDYAAISLIFLLKYVRLGALHKAALFQQMETVLSPFASSLPKNDSAYDYLEAMRCLSVNRVMTFDLWLILTDMYWSLFTPGFARHQLEQRLGETMQQVAPMLALVTAGPTQTLRFNVLAAEELRPRFTELGVPDSFHDSLVQLHTETRGDSKAIEAEFRRQVPSLNLVAERWESTAFSKCSLTALGQALAHSSLVGRTTFRAPLEIWIR